MCRECDGDDDVGMGFLLIPAIFGAMWGFGARGLGVNEHLALAIGIFGFFVGTFLLSWMKTVSDREKKREAEQVKSTKEV